MGIFHSKPKPGSQEERFKKLHREMRLEEKAKAARIEANRNPPGPGPTDGFRGEHRYGNGDIAIGTFLNGKLNGRGRFYSNDPYYPGWREGIFCNNKLQGQGKKQRPGTVAWDEGEFVEDNLVKGRFSAPKDSSWLYDEGEFVWSGGGFVPWEMRSHGRTIRQCRNGDRFEGTFKGLGEKREFDQGILYFLNPNDVPYESGVEYWGKYGERFEGSFENWSPIGRGRYDREGKLMDGEFVKWIIGSQWYDAQALAKKKEDDARREREAEEAMRKARMEIPNRAQVKDRTAKQSAIAAGWTAMQQNPANNWVAGGIGNPY